MEIDWFLVILSITGSISFIFGSLLLFKKGFVEKLQKGIWKEKNTSWTEKELFTYNKYTRGITLFVVGLMLIAYVVFALLY